MLKRLMGSSLRARRYHSQCREITLRILTLNMMILLCVSMMFYTEQDSPFTIQGRRIAHKPSQLVMYANRVPDKGFADFFFCCRRNALSRYKLWRGQIWGNSGKSSRSVGDVQKIRHLPPRTTPTRQRNSLRKQ